MYCIGHLIDVAGVLPRHLAKVLVDLKRLHEANLSWCTQYILACKEKHFVLHYLNSTLWYQGILPLHVFQVYLPLYFQYYLLVPPNLID